MFSLDPTLIQTLNMIMTKSSHAAMLSMFTNMTTRYNVNELFDNISQSEEFIKFVETNKDKTGKDIFKEFVNIQLYQLLDDQVTVIINDKKLNDIFENKSLTSDDQFEIFVGKAVVKFIESNNNDNDMVKQLKKNQEFRAFVKDIIVFSKLMTKDTVIDSPNDFYHNVVKYISDIITDLFYNSIDILELNGVECDNIDPIYESCISMIHKFNTLLNSKSQHIGSKRRRDDNNDNNDPKRPRK
jgi:hypothetical protein